MFCFDKSEACLALMWITGAERVSLSGPSSSEHNQKRLPRRNFSITEVFRRCGRLFGSEKSRTLTHSDKCAIIVLISKTNVSAGLPFLLQHHENHI